MTWIPVPAMPLRCGSPRRLCEGYSVCPETGEARNARNELLKAHRTDPRTLAVGVQAQEPNGRRVTTSCSLAGLIAQALVRQGLAFPPTPGSHVDRVTLADRRERPTLRNLRWMPVGDAAPAPIVLTARGLALLGNVPTPGGPC